MSDLPPVKGLGELDDKLAPRPSMLVAKISPPEEIIFKYE
jgi:hypothetical protein